jgi:hypothetical protein
MKYIKIIALLGLFISYSCEKEMFFDAGPEKSSKILLEKNLSYVEVDKSFNISLVSDSTDYLVFRGGEKLLKELSVNIYHDSLFISNHINGHWYKLDDPMELEIHISSSPKFYFAAPVKVSTIDTFRSSRLFIDFKSFCELNVTVNVSECTIFSPYDCFGNFVIKGKSDYANFYTNGSTLLKAEDLQIKTCFVRQNSISEVYLNEPEQLSVLFCSSGNVICKKTPKNINIQRLGIYATGQIVENK